jgi:hypothetical protein
VVNDEELPKCHLFLPRVYGKLFALPPSEFDLHPGHSARAALPGNELDGDPTRDRGPQIVQCPVSEAGFGNS